MTSQLEVEFVCQFVTDPPETIQSECLACRQIIRNPFQATCYGSGYCQACIEQIKLNDPCPSCKQQKFNTIEDKSLKQLLYALNVYCSHQAKGCQWKGKLGQLDNHLNLNQSTENSWRAVNTLKFNVFTVLSYSNAQVF